jgi:hypothetical protein
MAQETTPRNGMFIPIWLLALILVVAVAGTTFAVTSNYDTRFYLQNPITSTVTQATTVTQSATETSWSSITQVSQITVTSVSYAPNYNYGYNNPYPNQNYQCQYPYTQYCYGNQYNQYQSYSGIISQAGSCVLFNSSSGTFYLDLSNLNGNSYLNGLNGPATIHGYVETNYYQGGCGAYPLIYVGSISQ